MKYMASRVSFCLAFSATIACFAFNAPAALNSATWDNSMTEGWFTNSANWSCGHVPTGEDDVVRFMTTSANTGTEATIHVTDLDSEALTLGFQLYAPVKYNLDFSDATFRLKDVSGNARSRDGYWYPIFLLSGKTMTTYAFKMNFASGATKKEPIAVISDNVWTVGEAQQGNLEITFTGGSVDFVPDWESSGTMTRNMDFAADGDDTNFNLRIKDAQVRFPKSTWYGYAKNSLLEIDGGEARFMDDLSFGGHEESDSGTNVISIQNGGKLAFGGKAALANFDRSAGNAGRRTRIAVSGEGSTLDLSALATQANFVGNTDVVVEDGASLALAKATYFTGLSAVDQPTKRLVFSGAETKIDDSDAATFQMSGDLDVVFTNGVKAVFGVQPKFQMASAGEGVVVSGSGTVLDCSKTKLALNCDADVTVSDGASLVGGGSDTRFGCTTASRRRTIRFTGTGTEVSARNQSSLYFYGNDDIVFSDGAVADFSSANVYWGLMAQTAASADRGYTTRLAIEGDTTKFCASRKFIVGGNTADYDSAQLDMDGGFFGAKDKSQENAYVSMWLAYGTTATGTVNVNGGTMDLLDDAKSDTGGTLTLGPGTATFNMNGGTFFCGDVYPGYTGGTSARQQSFNMNGGTATVGRVYFGVARTGDTLRHQNASFNLNGGVLTASSVFVHDETSEAFKDQSVFSANGGTLKCKTNQANFFYGFRHAELGSGGLIVDVGSWSPGIAQSFTDKAGERGLFVKKGSGTLTFKMESYEVSQTVVEKGTLTFDADRTLATELVITNGATVSLSGAPTVLTVDALTVPDGIIRVDAGDRIHIRSAKVDFSGLRVQFGTAPTADQAYGLFTFDGDVTTNAGVRAAVRRIALANSVAAGKYAAFTTSYDEGSGQTTLTLTVKDVAGPLTDRTTWTGPEWTEDGWSDGIPTSAKIASFSNPSAPSAVTVPAGAEFGAAEFTAGSHVLSGVEPLEISGELGAIRIDVTAGDQVFELPLASAWPVPVALAAGTSLALEGSFIDGGIAKTGKGRLVLSADNEFQKDVSIGGGINVVTADHALRTRGQASWTGDTLLFTNDTDTALTIAQLKVNETESKTNAVVINAAVDVEIVDLTVSSGAIIKRGAGRLTVNAKADAELVLEPANGTIPTSTYGSGGNAQAPFAEDGTAPTKGYNGFGIAEGEVLFKGVPGDKAIKLPYSYNVGLGFTGMSAAPVLAVDGATVTGSSHAYCPAVYSGDGVRAVGFRVTNGGVLSASSWHFGDGYQGLDGTVTIALTNGELQAANCFYTSGTFAMYGGTNIVRAKDSKMVVTTTGSSNFGFSLEGSLDWDFDNCDVGNVKAVTPFRPQNNTEGQIVFRNGSRLWCSGFGQRGANQNLKFSLVFDDAEWIWWDGDTSTDYVFDTIQLVKDDSYLNRRPFVMRGKGLVLAPPAGVTFTDNYPFSGDGGFVKKGAGTVAFGAGAYAFTGLLDVQEGVVDLTNAGELAAVTAKGPGTIKGGTITRLTLKETLEGGALSGRPILNGVTADSVVVDLGRDETDPLDPEALENLTVATVASGTSVGRWKLAGTGVPHLKGTFAVEGDKVVLKSTLIPGMLLLVR